MSNLNQEDIDILIQQIAVQSGKGSSSIHPNFGSDIVPNNPIYDFLRPTILTKDNYRAYSIVHDSILKSYSQWLSIRLKADIILHIAEISTCNFEEWCRYIPEPGIFLKYKLNDNFFYVQFDNLLNSLLLKEKPKALPLKQQYNITDSEKIMIGEWAKHFGHIIESELRDIVNANVIFDSVHTTILDFRKDFWNLEAGLIITCEINNKNMQYEGIISLFYPWPTIRKFRDKMKPVNFSSLQIEGYSIPYNKIMKIDTELSYRTYKKIPLSKIDKAIEDLKLNLIEITTGKRVIAKGLLRNRNIVITELTDEGVKDEMEKTNIVDNLQNIEVTLSVELGRTRKSVKDILQFGEGTIVELETNAGEPVDIYVNNVRYAKGEVVSCDDMYGIRVTEILQQKSPF